jgi:hypothetical protein
VAKRLKRDEVELGQYADDILIENTIRHLKGLEEGLEETELR